MTSRFRSVLLLATVFVLGTVARSRAGEPIPFPPGPIQADDENNRLPKLIQRVEPPYPAAATDKSVSAAVWVAFIVDQKGNVVRPRAMFGRFPQFEQAAVDTVQQWRFTPGMHEGRPASTQFVVLVEFSPPKA